MNPNFQRVQHPSEVISNPEEVNKTEPTIWELHRLSYRLLTNTDSINNLAERRKKIQEAVTILEEILRRHNNNDIASYNLACAFALMSETYDQNQEPTSWNIIEDLRIKAVCQLQHAIQSGYSNVAFIEKDRDFNSIRSLPKFQALLNGLKISQPRRQTVAVPQKQQTESQPKQEERIQPKKEEEIQQPRQVIESKQDEVKVEAKPNQVEVPEAVKVEKKPETKYHNEIQQLVEMGFPDRALNEQVLNSTNGDIAAAINVLFRNF